MVGSIQAIRGVLSAHLVFAVIFGSISASAHQHSGDFTALISAEDLSQMRLIDRGDGQNEWMSLADAMKLSEKAHESGRCGGFFDVTDQLQVDSTPLPFVELFRLNLGDRPMTQQAYLSENLGRLEAQRMSKTVTHLSSYRNRYYKSEHGVEAAKWIAGQFQAIAKNRSDIKVNFFKHDKWPQPSVIATIPGQGPQAKEIVVIGGHEDSINQWGFGRPEMEAPGADDNASGVATILEVYRVLVESGFKPNRTLMFMTYAAEEVGLLGSQEIANQFKTDGRSVVAVAQFDMTGFAGSGDQVTFMTDFTNPELTKFTQQLMDTYVKAKWSTDQCGYACSDHASWTKAGYSSVMPFESTMSEDNKAIHSKNDVISKLDFKHGLHFAKLALSFMAELSK